MTSSAPTPLPTSGRPRPAESLDTEFFWNGTREHRLLIQRCMRCHELRHPPGPACPRCHSFDWDAIEAGGQAVLHSYVVQHHPRVPGFDDPAVVALVELAEGTRLVTNVDADPDSLVIGEPLELFFLDQEGGWTVPQFRRAAHRPLDSPG